MRNRIGRSDVYYQQMDNFETVWKTYYPKLRVYGKSFSGLTESDIEDCIQDIFMTLHEKRDGYNPRYAFSTWLYRIARNRFIDYTRSAARRVPLEVPQCLHTGPDAAASRDAAIDLTRAMAKLSDTQRELFYWHYAENYSLAEISAICGRSMSGIKSQLFRGRKLLASELEDDYGYK